MKTASRAADTERSVTVVATGPLTWAVFDRTPLEADTVLGRIHCDGDRFRVGLVGEDLEPYSFATLRESESWFAEYRFALALGRRSHGYADGTPT